MAKKGRSVAEVSSPEQAERLQTQEAEERKRLWRAIERIGERNADRDPDEVLREVTDVVEQVRQERYEAEQRRQTSGGR